MVDIKTKQNSASVEDFINSVDDVKKRNDSFALLDIMKQVSGEEPKMWGASLIGFGKIIVKSPKTNREVEWLKIGFSPRKANLSLYLTGNILKYGDFLKKLGKHKTGVGCLYVNRLEDIDLNVLKELIDTSFKSDHFV